MLFGITFPSNGGSARGDNPDPALLGRCLRSDRPALDELFGLSYPVVRRFVAKILGPGATDLEDVVQSALIEIFRSLKSFRGEARFTSWTYRICLNVAGQHIRRRSGKPETEAIYDDELAADEWGEVTSSEKGLLDREALAKAYEIIHALPANLRQVFILSEMEEMGAAEIAEVLDCSVQAAWSRLHQARKQFWKKVERSEYFRRVRPGGESGAGGEKESAKDGRSEDAQ